MKLSAENDVNLLVSHYFLLEGVTTEERYDNFANVNTVTSFACVQLKLTRTTLTMS